MKLYRKFLKRMETDKGYDNEKLAKDLEAIAEKHQALQLLQTDVSNRSQLLMAFSLYVANAKEYASIDDLIIDFNNECDSH